MGLHNFSLSLQAIIVVIIITSHHCRYHYHQWPVICKELKATRHLICSSCSNWVDFVKSGCEKSFAEVQTDSFSFECRGCTRMKELELELEQLRLLVVAVVGREQVVCAIGSGEGTVDKVGEDDERDARVNSPQPGRRLRGGKVTGRRETGRKETGHRETG